MDIQQMAFQMDIQQTAFQMDIQQMAFQMDIQQIVSGGKGLQFEYLWLDKVEAGAPVICLL